MPNRIIKESIRTSRSVNAMTDFQFRLWVYLITYVDDYGRGSADPEILKGFVFPRRKRVSESDIDKALAELADMGCIHLYDVDGESYFCFPNWGDHQRIQTKKSKFPEPPKFAAPQKSTVVHGDIPPESNPNPNPNPNPKTREDALAGFEGELRLKLEEWLRYKAERKESYKPTGLKSFTTQVQNQRKTHSDREICVLIDECMSNGWKGIIWDKLKAPKQNPSAKTGESSLDMDKIRAFMHREAME